MSRASTIRPSHPSPAKRASWVTSRNSETAANCPPKKNAAVRSVPSLRSARPRNSRIIVAAVRYAAGFVAKKSEVNMDHQRPSFKAVACTEATSRSASGGPDRKLLVAAPAPRNRPRTARVNGTALKCCCVRRRARSATSDHLTPPSGTEPFLTIT
ncbi:hypothetical protein D9M72_404490 [compost metagenome]